MAGIRLNEVRAAPVGVKGFWYPADESRVLGSTEEVLTDSRQIPLSQDAALVVALVGTAIPFAHSAEDEAERWLRAMRLHGQVGSCLQALGVGEAPLGTAVLEDVTDRAAEFAVARSAENVGTMDILFAVLDIYGKLFDRVLYMRGTSRDELVERLTAAAARR
jgi:hypothetical protein